MPCRHSWVWLPATNMTDHSNGNLLMIDLGICQKCKAYTTRHQVATLGQQVSAELWGEQRFEVVRLQQEDV